MSRVAVVSGGSRGIGYAIARELALQGCDCLIAARNAENLAAAQRKLAAESKRTIETCAADLRALQGCEAVFAAVREKFGRADILINNAGATRGGDFLRQPDAEWEDGFALKFYAAVRLSRLFWPLLTESRGYVVSIVGGFARTPDPDFMVGGAVNAAMANFTKALAGRGLRDDVNVNVVHPGLTVTERMARAFEQSAARRGIDAEEARRRTISRQGVRRIGEPEDVAKLTAFLCSPAARHIHGTAVAVDGGATEGLY